MNDFSIKKKRIDYITEQVTNIPGWPRAAVIHITPEGDHHLWHNLEDFASDYCLCHTTPDMERHAVEILARARAIAKRGDAIPVILDWGMGIGVFSVGRP